MFSSNASFSRRWLLGAALCSTLPAVAWSATEPSPFTVDSDTQVVWIEAESHHGSASVGGHAWKLNKAVAGFSGSGAMRALPDDKVARTSGYVGKSPRLDYKVSFPEAGTYYIWVRGHGPNSGADSVHLGLNGKAQASGEKVSIPRTKGYAWGGGSRSVKVPSAGVHTLNLWMHESGAVVDRMLVTKRKLSNAEQVPPPAPATAEAAPAIAFDSATQLARFEAEEHHGSSVVGGQQWKANTTVSGFRGKGALRALPENTVTISTGYVSKSPRLDYRLSFPKAGTYYVWVRGHAPGGGSDSLHVGLNGKAQTSGENLTLAKTKGYVWSPGTHTVSVPSAGTHTLNLWMRESGVVVDQVLVTSRKLADPDKVGADTPPPAPAPVGYVTLTWKANKEPVTGYRVYYGPAASSTVVEIANLKTADPSFSASAPKAEFRIYEDLGIKPGDQACFRLRAYDKTGLSGYTQSVCVKV